MRLAITLVSMTMFVACSDEPPDDIAPEAPALLIGQPEPPAATILAGQQRRLFRALAAGDDTAGELITLNFNVDDHAALRQLKPDTSQSRFARNHAFPDSASRASSLGYFEALNRLRLATDSTLTIEVLDSDHGTATVITTPASRPHVVTMWVVDPLNGEWRARYMMINVADKTVARMREGARRSYVVP